MPEVAVYILAGVSLAFIVGVSLWIDVKDLDDRQFESVGWARLSKLFETIGALGMTVLFVNMVVPESEVVATYSVLAMLGGFVAKSALDVLRVRQPAIDRT